MESPAESLLLLKPSGAVGHQGGVRFRPDSEEYRTLRNWIAGGAKLTLEKSRQLELLEVTPQQQVLVEPAVSVQLRVTARFTGGDAVDVTRLACYETSNLNVSVDHNGLVIRVKPGEATVIVRYLHKQTPVQLAFVPLRPDFVESSIPTDSIVDEHVFAKLNRLRMNPSPLADDATFLRRVYLDCIGVIPAAEEAAGFVNDASADKRRRD